MERKVFISHALDDPEWPESEVFKLAEEFEATDRKVCLDLRHETSRNNGMSDADWWQWMERELEASTHVVCLWSQRYAAAWKRDVSISRGNGLAYEIVWIQAYLNEVKQNNNGRVIVLVRGREALGGLPIVFKSVVYVCDHSDAAVMEKLKLMLASGKTDTPMSSLLHGKVSVKPQKIDGSGFLLEDIVPVDGTLIRHQASFAAMRLRVAEQYWIAIAGSLSMRGLFPEEAFDSPARFVKVITSFRRKVHDDGASLPDARALKDVMRETRRAFRQLHECAVRSDEELHSAAAATVAVYLLCACLMIEAKASGVIVGLPKMEEQGAAPLLASLIAVSMVGGSLGLIGATEGVLPVGSGTRVMKIVGSNIKDDFERQLYSTTLGKKPWTFREGLKVGQLTSSQRDELLVALEEERDAGMHTRAICFVVETDVRPEPASFDLAEKIGVPVFHRHDEPAYEVLGMSDATLISLINHLWRDICAALYPETESRARVGADDASAD